MLDAVGAVVITTAVGVLVVTAVISSSKATVDVCGSNAERVGNESSCVRIGVKM